MFKIDDLVRIKKSDTNVNVHYKYIGSIGTIEGILSSTDLQDSEGYMININGTNLLFHSDQVEAI